VVRELCPHAPTRGAGEISGAHDAGSSRPSCQNLYDLDVQAKEAGVSIIPGVGFGVVATNCLALYVSEAVGGAEHLEVASRVASAQPGPGAAATMQENLPYGGWIRHGGHLVPKELFTGLTTISFPDGPCEAMPSRPAISKRPSTPQDLPTSLPTPSALPSETSTRLPTEIRRPRPSGRSGGPGQSAQTAPRPRLG
jgi:hypothetical protein